MTRAQRAVTLTELMIALVIISILSVTIFMTVAGSVDDSETAFDQNKLDILQWELDLAYAIAVQETYSMLDLPDELRHARLTPAEKRDLVEGWAAAPFADGTPRVKPGALLPIERVEIPLAPRITGPTIDELVLDPRLLVPELPLRAGGVAPTIVPLETPPLEAYIPKGYRALAGSGERLITPDHEVTYDVITPDYEPVSVFESVSLGQTQQSYPVITVDVAFARNVIGSVLVKVERYREDYLLSKMAGMRFRNGLRAVFITGEEGDEAEAGNLTDDFLYLAVNDFAHDVSAGSSQDPFAEHLIVRETVNTDGSYSWYPVEGNGSSQLGETNSDQGFGQDLYGRIGQSGRWQPGNVKQTSTYQNSVETSSSTVITDINGDVVDWTGELDLPGSDSGDIDDSDAGSGAQSNTGATGGSEGSEGESGGDAGNLGNWNPDGRDDSEGEGSSGSTGSPGGGEVTGAGGNEASGSGSSGSGKGEEGEDEEDEEDEDESSESEAGSTVTPHTGSLTWDEDTLVDFLGRGRADGTIVGGRDGKHYISVFGGEYIAITTDANGKVLSLGMRGNAYAVYDSADELLGFAVGADDGEVDLEVHEETRGGVKVLVFTSTSKKSRKE